MQSLRILAFCGLVLAALAVDVPCVDPFTSAVPQFGGDVGIESIPINKNQDALPLTMPVCGYYVNVPLDNTCCSDDTMKVVLSAVTLTDARVAAMPNAVAARATSLMSLINSTYATVCEKPGSCPANTTAIVPNAQKDLNSALAAVQNSWPECTNSLRAYYRGMYCIPCRPDTSTLTDDKKQEVLVHPEACNHVSLHCLGALQTVQAAMLALAKTVDTLTKALPSFPVDISSYADGCGSTLGAAVQPGDCGSFVCTKLLDGFGVHTDVLNSSLPVSRNVYSATGHKAYLIGCADLDCPEQHIDHPEHYKWGLVLLAVFSLLTLVPMVLEYYVQGRLTCSSSESQSMM